MLLSVALAPALPASACDGDCDGDGSVRVNELVTGVRIALSQEEVDACVALDRDNSGEVRVEELLAAVNNSVHGCPAVTPSPTPTATPGTVAETRCAVPPGDGVNFDPTQPFCELLSSYRFFVGDAAEQQPNEGVLPFDLNTPLFSDFALKHRFVWMPEGTSATYHGRDSFTFPVGTVIIKTFAYPASFQDPESAQHLIETRLIVRRASGWDPITYVWNQPQSEARRRIIGASVPVSWIDIDGATQQINYQVPNTNQCKECHEEHSGVFGPLGPKARNLNKTYPYADGEENQLTRWTAMGYLQGAPDPSVAPRAAVFDDPTTGSVEFRARTYLDVNCGNCHNTSGLARTSGLYLDIGEDDPAELGICKPPVAAGQGSGGRKVDIFPGRPDESILVYRMESTKPGEAMPELGRQTVHTDALAVIREWIEAIPGTCNVQ
jgi:uncharacterized repeat protein (TIGR03806 family)